MRTRLVFVLLLSGLMLACSPAPKPSVIAPTKTVDPSTVGSITGSVRFDGTPPTPTKIPVAGFPECGNSQPFDSDVLIRDGLVQNAFVYVKSGLENYAFPPTDGEVALDQKGCLYEPRVIGLRVGQTVVVTNSDPLLHNVHALPKRSRSFNLAMTHNAVPLRRSFDEPEVMVGLRCDIHPWMRAYVGVLPHPAFAVTGPDGRFEIKGVPPGTYTLSVWHERLGTAEQTVTLGVKEEKMISIVFQ